MRLEKSRKGYSACAVKHIGAKGRCGHVQRWAGLSPAEKESPMEKPPGYINLCNISSLLHRIQNQTITFRALGTNPRPSG